MRQRLFVTLSVLLAWYFSFLIIFVLPLDVSSTAFRQCNSTASPSGSSSVSSTTVSPADHSVITIDDINKTRAIANNKVRQFCEILSVLYSS